MYAKLGQDCQGRGGGERAELHSAPPRGVRSLKLVRAYLRANEKPGFPLLFPISLLALLLPARLPLPLASCYPKALTLTTTMSTDSVLQDPRVLDSLAKLQACSRAGSKVRPQPPHLLRFLTLVM